MHICTVYLLINQAEELHTAVPDPIQDSKRYQKLHFTRCFTGLWNLISHFQGRTWIKNVWGQTAEQDIWTWDT